MTVKGRRQLLGCEHTYALVHALRKQRARPLITRLLNDNACHQERSANTQTKHVQAKVEDAKGLRRDRVTDLTPPPMPTRHHNARFSSGRRSPIDQPLSSPILPHSIRIRSWAYTALLCSHGNGDTRFYFTAWRHRRAAA